MVSDLGEFSTYFSEGNERIKTIVKVEKGNHGNLLSFKTSEDKILVSNKKS